MNINGNKTYSAGFAALLLLINQRFGLSLDPETFNTVFGALGVLMGIFLRHGIGKKSESKKK